MKLIEIAEIGDNLYAEFIDVPEFTITLEKNSSFVSDLHFSIIIEAENIVEQKGYRLNEDKKCIYENNMLKIPVLKSENKI